MGELYVTIARRFNYDYRDAIKGKLEDSGVYRQIVDIQASLNHGMIREYSSYDNSYYLLLPLRSAGGRRVFAVERLATKVAESRAYTGMQRVIDRVRKRG